jgi:type II secretory pathway predicted ATPase ExeA
VSQPRIIQPHDLSAALDAFAPDAPTSAFYPSLGHQDALNRLSLLATPGVLILISGDAGMGKSMLVSVAAETLPSSIVPVIAGPVDETTTDVRFLKSLIAATGQRPQGRTGLELTTELLDWAGSLAGSGRSATIVVDDAHRRTGTQLEVIRTLVTAASPTAPLSVLLLGEPDLLDRVNRKRNLARRVTLHYALNPLSDTDGAALAAHRLRSCGYRPDAVFSHDASLDLARLAGGNPGAIVHLARLAIEENGLASGPITERHILALTGDPAATSAFRPAPGSGALPVRPGIKKGGDAMNENRNPDGSRRANVAQSANEKTGAPTPDFSSDSNRLSG